MKLKRVSSEDIIRCQQRGYFDEHLVALYSTAYGDPYLYEDNYLLYHDPGTKNISLTLFGLARHLDSERKRIDCFNDLIVNFKPRRVVVTSPSKLPSQIKNYVCDKIYEDNDYQISLGQFDENLSGGSYKSLRYRINHAKRCGYSLAVGKKLTPGHMNIMAHHLIKSRTYELWDYQLYLGLNEYISRFVSPQLFNVISDDLLIGFDVTDFLGDVMAVPLGFYLDYPSIADFLIYEEIIRARKQGFKWLDIGWACNVPGLEGFKIKWKAIPKFHIYMQVFIKA